jgi:hypothetical protein
MEGHDTSIIFPDFLIAESKDFVQKGAVLGIEK